MRLHSSLVSLVVAAAIPLVIFAAVVAALLVRHEQDNFAQVALDRNRAFISAVDAQLTGHIRTLQAIAELRSIAEEDLPTVRRDLVAVVATQPDWYTAILTTPDGVQLVNTLVPLGEPLPAPGDAQTIRQAAASRAPVVGNLLDSRVLPGAKGIPIRIPVMRAGHTVYVLSAILKPGLFEALIRQQHLPRGWVSGLVDSTGRFIARVPPREIGTLASEEYRAQVAKAREGWYRGSTVEGNDTYTAHTSPDLSNWSVGFAIPASVVLAGAQRAAWAMAGGALVCIAAAITIAVWMGRRISRPIAFLASSVPSLGTSDVPLYVASEIDEVRDLVGALNTASNAIQERSALAERERQALEASDRAKDEFIAMLSHELRNPLSALTAAAQILKATRPQTDMAIAAQGVIERQTRQMTRLVEDLLDISRITMGKTHLSPEVFDLKELAGRLVDTWRASGRLAQHEVSARTQPVWVNADRARMEQIISNLLDNAIKFTPAGKAIELDVYEEGGAAKIVVTDSGAGIDPAQIDHIFDLFVQGPQDLSRQAGGLGVRWSSTSSRCTAAR